MSVNERTPLLASEQEENPDVWIVEIPKDVRDYEPFGDSNECCYGLTLEELLPYKEDIWWQNVRRTVFGSIWFTFFLLLFVACFSAYLQIGMCPVEPTDSPIASTTITIAKIAP